MFVNIINVHRFRCKMRQRDSRLFYLSMEVTVRKPGVKRVFALDDDARPAILQACHPKGDSRYVYSIDSTSVKWSGKEERVFN